MEEDVINKQVQSLCEDLDVQYKFSEALAWADLYGGSIIVVMADDGRMLDEPLNYDGLRRIEKLKVFDKTNIVGSKQYTDASAPQYMDVEQYYINTFGSNPMWVHESRVLRFDGGRLPLYQRNLRLGWGAKRFESIKDEFKKLLTAVLCALFLGVNRSDGVFYLVILQHHSYPHITFVMG